MRIYLLLFGILAIFLCSCTHQQVIEQSNSSFQGDRFWTLDFFYFFKGKQSHTESLQFTSRRDCFEALYQMQVQAREKPLHSGAGICTKKFVEGQVRTQDDVLGYK